MEECEIIYEKGETEEKISYEPIIIEKNNIKYILNIEAEENKITFSINNKDHFPSINYNRTMSFKELKNIYIKLKSFNDFYEHLKQLTNNYNLNIKKSNDKITLIIKPKVIEIDLYKTKKDINLNIEEIFQELINLREKIKDIDKLKNENNNLKTKMEGIINEMNIIKEENKKLNKEIDILKLNNNKNKLNNEIYNIKEEDNKIINENKNNEIKNNLNNYLAISSFKSSIMKDEEEEEMIFQEIENKMNKRIKDIKKLYQATIDGGAPINFHKNCDNIPNTLVLIKSEGNRRFGGFTTIPWKSNGNYCIDSEKKTFIFSLDNKEIYHLNDDRAAVYHNKKYGPCFGEGFDIGIEGNPIKEEKLYTCQTSCYDYKGNINSLSEYEFPNNLKALEYEIFQFIFC